MAVKKLEYEKTLFKLNKNGAIQMYIVKVYSYDDGAILQTEYGIVGGAIQKDIKPIYPKNVGRANSTTPVSQGELEANSKVNKLMDKSYVVLPSGHFNEAELRDFLESRIGKDPFGRYLPMLASKKIEKAEWPGFIDRKLDGNRCIIENVQGVITARSRKGKPFELDHITDLFEGILPPGYCIDGEVYLHGSSLQNIVSMVKNTSNPMHSEIKYVCYDLFGDKANDLVFQKRKILLARFVRKINNPIVTRNRSYKVHSLEEAMELFNKFVEEGYEGAIYRNPSYPYEYGSRSKGLIKIKGFLEEEFKIVGMEEATGRDQNTAIFVLETEDGTEFNSRPMGTREQRTYYWENPEEFIGQMATVIFQYWTDGGVPGHSRVKNVRDVNIQGGDENY